MTQWQHILYVDNKSGHKTDPQWEVWERPSHDDRGASIGKEQYQLRSMSLVPTQFFCCSNKIVFNNTLSKDKHKWSKIYYMQNTILLVHIVKCKKIYIKSPNYPYSNHVFVSWETFCPLLNSFSISMAWLKWHYIDAVYMWPRVFPALPVVSKHTSRELLTVVVW